MPRHSPGQPGAMVTDSDKRTWTINRTLGGLLAAALLIGLGYALLS